MIKYSSEKDFYDGVHYLVQRALRFEANFDKLEIKLTGGF
jgi:hypothetical protein|tara:strand:+ start:324 stop:443 length:120 start_codon:yes stop_codon:yes gene_type:complete